MECLTFDNFNYIDKASIISMIFKKLFINWLICIYDT